MLKSLMMVVVARKVTEAADIVVFELADPAGGDLPPFSAGSHIDVEVLPGQLRQYSLCNNPAERSGYSIGVLKELEGRGGSAAMHALKAGAQIKISEPRNHFALQGGAKRSILFAGGIGVTPILCMAERLSHIGAEFEMHYSARSPERMAFRQRILTATYAERVQLHFDNGPPEQKLDIDAALGAPSPDAHVYVCGPPAFIDFVMAAAKTRGFNDQCIHREYFKTDPEAAGLGNDTFSVKISSTGEVFEVPPDHTVLEILREQGVEVQASCEQGVCGTCLTRVLEGIPDHRDYYLTDAERDAGDQFTPCCSRALTRILVLDL